jgi:hypothetical protein
MPENETKQRFIELRAKGTSYEKIANELSVSKHTLIKWSHDLELEISNFRAIEIDSLYDQYYVSKQKRIEILGKNLELLKDALEKRDYSELPTDKLLDFVMKFSSLLKSEFTTTVFKEKTELQIWDSTTIKDWTG